tara:strand:- start:619 stop:951 length:333 start_codon:yes stop_codon:yes gene_type:complete
MKVLKRKSQPIDNVRISTESLTQLAFIMKRIVLCSTAVEDKQLAIAVGNEPPNVIIKPAAVWSPLLKIHKVAKHIIVIDPLPSTCVNGRLVSIPHAIENVNIQSPLFISS